jgi:hypothetical protein
LYATFMHRRDDGKAFLRPISTLVLKWFSCNSRFKPVSGATGGDGVADDNAD